MAESMQGLHRTCRCAEVTKEMIGKEVVLMGWVQKARDKGGIIFVDLRDRSGIMQLIFENGSIDEEGFAKAGKLRSEFVIAVTGVVEERGGAVNKNLATGEIELRVKSLRVLSEAEVPPFPIEENSKTKDEIRLKYRYLDLRRPDLQKNIMLKSKVMMITRQFFAKEGFLEIETPMLGKSTPEGARDYLVPSRVHPGHFYGLPQSPQLYKQLLMCSGYDRYIQIARCFRDEDLRADRQPEFTQIDMELSFVDVDDVIDVNERFLAYLFKEVLDIDVKLPIQRITWQEAMDRFGSDKPDMRFGMELHDVSDVVKNCGFSVFTSALENGGSVRGINAEGQGAMPRKKIDKLVEFAKGYGAKGLAYIAIAEDGTRKSSFAKFMTDEEMDALVVAMDGKAGDLLLFAADRKKLVYDVLGALRLELAKQMDLLDKNEYRFVWITEFPLLEWSEEENRFTAMHHPFTMPMEEDLHLIDSDPGAVRAKAYDIVLNGNEIGGGSVRIHQNDIQEKMFECLGISKNFHEALYKAFLGAGVNLPKYKKMILTVKDSDKIDAIDIGRRFEALGYEIFSTKSTCRVLNEAGVHAKQINKLEEESPNLLDLILDDKIDLVIDTPSQGVGRSRDGFLIRRYAIETGVTCLTSLDTADALLTSLETGNRDQLSVVDIAQI